MTCNLVFTLEGFKGRFENILIVNNKRLKLSRSQRFINHSNEFNWGNQSSGATQTSLAVLLSAGLEFAEASYVYYQLKDKFISILPNEGGFKASVLISIYNSKIKNINYNIFETKGILKRRKKHKYHGSYLHQESL